MAENEILDMGGTRWKRTRLAMAAPDSSLTDVADCMAGDLTASVRLQLASALQQGQTLLLVFQAAGESRAALQAAVESFRGRWLALTIRDAIKEARSNDPRAIALCAADRLIDACIDKASVFSGRYHHFQERSEREALRDAAALRLRSCRGEIAAVVEASLRGEAVRRQRRPVVGPTPVPSVQKLVSMSLMRNKSGGSHVPGP